jgi:hypothetical protein
MSSMEVVCNGFNQLVIEISVAITTSSAVTERVKNLERRRRCS